jgi:hypothetical protein
LNKEAFEMAYDELMNPSFEDDFTPRGAPEMTVGKFWEPFFDKTLTRPEWGAEAIGKGRERVRTGSKAQKMFTSYAYHDAGVWQRINVTPGKWYEFTAWLHVWVSNQDDPDVSEGQYHAMVGANPWGHWPAHYASVYGKEVLMDQYDVYTPVQVVFQAWVPTVSVIVRGRTENKYKHNDLYIDDCAMRVVDVYIDEPPPPAPPPAPPPTPGEIDYELIASMTAERVMGLQAIDRLDLLMSLLELLQTNT